jgi:ABC-type branched-subunit amino acid transport system ATPase component
MRDMQGSAHALQERIESDAPFRRFPNGAPGEGQVEQASKKLQMALQKKKSAQELNQYRDVKPKNLQLLMGLGILGFETDVDKETGKYRVFSNNSTLKYSIENIIKDVKSMMGTLFSMVYDVDGQETVQRYIEKAKLFKKIFDERNSITKKTIELDMGEGFEILKETKDTPLYFLSKEKKDIMDKYNGFKILQNGKEIPIQCLSSGEKHDFIMFFELIFQPMECEVIMIDEPEVSLHIQWQKTFVDYILEICKVNKLQVLIATHSPSIINGHTELYANKEMVQL